VVEDGKVEFDTIENMKKDHFVCEEPPVIGANIEVADIKTASDEDIALYQWRSLREEQDKAFEEALLADQAKVLITCMLLCIS